MNRIVHYTSETMGGGLVFAGVAASNVTYTVLGLIFFLAVKGYDLLSYFRRKEEDAMRLRLCRECPHLTPDGQAWCRVHCTPPTRPTDAA